MDHPKNIDYRRDEIGGFQRINGANIWIAPPYEEHPDWRWEAVLWDGTYPDGVVRYHAGIGAISGRADSEEEALRLARTPRRGSDCWTWTCLRARSRLIRLWSPSV